MALTGLETEIRGIEELIQHHQRLADQIKKAENDLAEKMGSHDILVMVCQVLDPKSGLPVALIEERLPELENGINQYLERFGSPEFNIQIRSKDEKGNDTLDFLVDNGVQPMLDAAAYSGGQLDRIELCLKWALGDLAEDMRDMSLGLLAFDEPAVHLDEDRKTAMIEMIRERCTSGRTPVSIVISHDRKLILSFPVRIVVAPSPDGPKMVQA